jgi:hypothetical protein
VFQKSEGVSMTVHGRALACVLVLSAAACSMQGAGAERPFAPSIGLQRGSGSSSLVLKPPYLFGPSFTLRLQRNELTGWSSGDMAPSGTLRVKIDDDGAAGQGPHGSIAVEYLPVEAGTMVEGRWNGERVQLLFSADGIRGFVTDNSPRPPLARNALEPGARQSSCEYRLKAVQIDGAFAGTSSCEGMPEDTRLQIPSVALALFTRSELITLLVAVLSAPPAARAERGMAFGEPTDPFGFADVVP